MLFGIFVAGLVALFTYLFWIRSGIGRRFAGWKQEVAEYDHARLCKKLKILCRYIWPNETKVQIKAVICLLLVATGRVFNLVFPWLAKYVVDEMTHEKHLFWDLVAMTLGFFCLQGNGYVMDILSDLQHLVYLSVRNHMSTRIQVDFYRHVIRLPYTWYSDKGSGELSDQFSTNSKVFEDFPEDLIFSFLPGIGDALIALVFFTTTFDFNLAVILSIVAMADVVINKVIMQWNDRVDKAESEDADSSIEMTGLHYNETVKYFGNEEFEVEKFRKTMELENRRLMKREKFSHFTSMIQCVSNDILLMLSTFFMAYQRNSTASLNFTAGDYVLFSNYFFKVTSPLHTIQFALSGLRDTLEKADNLIEILEIPEENKGKKLKNVEIKGSLRLENVSFSYVEGSQVLHNLNFEVPEGKTVAVVGPTGSGKSTLIRMLYRFLEPTEGTIFINNIDTRDLDVYEYRRQIGVVPQDCVLFNDTIKYNLRYAKLDVDEKEIEQATRAAQIDEMIQKKPEKYETKVGERGMKLSGGEKQRMAIARTILKNPKYLFMDEATSSLDTLTERQIQKALTDLSKNKTCVIVAHRLSTIVHADNIVVLKDGRVLEQGNHKKLLESDGLYAKMWNLQQGGDFSQ